jgi:FdhE protein
MTQEVWLSSHPYLRPVAELHALVNDTLADTPATVAADLHWNSYLNDFHRGVPLLHSQAAEKTLTLAEEMIEAPLANLTSSLRGKLAEEGDASLAEIHRDTQSSGRVVNRLVGGGEFARPGLMRFLGWTVLSRQILPLVSSFFAWREEERWLRPYCPTCGSPPAMAQLVGTDPGRQRFLACGCCKTRWQYRRTRCPFCEDPDDHRLSVLAVEGEGGLRIDYCESCRGYLKTYEGQGSESVLLADWTSIHLDVVATDRALKRLAGSVYEI